MLPDKKPTTDFKEYIVKVYYLELLSRDQIRFETKMATSAKMEIASNGDPDLARSLYLEVGEDWYWVDRYFWSFEQWRNRLSDPSVSLWIMKSDFETLGYYELEKHQDDSIEICYFGLLPNSIGLGLGGQMLTDALRRAFDLGASRLWLHTCCLDHPNALANYKSRGMEIYKICQEVQLIPQGWSVPSRFSRGC